MKKFLSELAWSAMVVFICSLLTVVAYVLREPVLGFTTASIALLHALDVLIGWRRLMTDPVITQLQLPPARVEAFGFHQKNASALSAYQKRKTVLHALDFLGSDATHESTQTVDVTLQQHSALHQPNTPPAVQAVSHADFLIFRHKPVNANGSEILEMEDEIRIFRKADLPILVISAFRSNKQGTPTLADHFKDPSAVTLRELTCVGIFAGVDLIPHAGNQAWHGKSEVAQLLLSFTERYRHILLWLPECEYLGWAPVIDHVNLEARNQAVANPHFGSDTTRLFKESVM